MSDKWEIKPSRRVCRSCGKVLVGFRNADGVLKLKCPVCGLEEAGGTSGAIFMCRRATI